MDCKHPDLKPLSAYVRGCRCPRCREGNRVYHAAYRKQNPKVIRRCRLQAAAKKRLRKEN